MLQLKTCAPETVDRLRALHSELLEAGRVNGTPHASGDMLLSRVFAEPDSLFEVTQVTAGEPGISATMHHKGAALFRPIRGDWAVEVIRQRSVDSVIEIPKGVPFRLQSFSPDAVGLLIVS